MRWENIIDADNVRRTLNVLKPDGQLFEVRILGNDKRRILSGYFTDPEVLLSAFDTVDLRGQNIYISLNRINEALYSRVQHDRFVLNTSTTSDTEVDEYQWLFIDFDPVRPAGVSSSNTELKKAEEKKDEVKEYLSCNGFPDPVEAISGNGFHLLYNICFQNNEENRQTVKDFLGALSDKFNSDDVKVDVTNFNPSRICKLHGTLAQKGANTAARPHRMSKLLVVPDRITTAGKELLEKIIRFTEPSEKKPAPAPALVRKEFDIREWLSHYNMTYKEDVGKDCQMFLLDECPFDHNHRNGDAKIFAYNDGAIAFKCHHNSCAGYKWQDVRLLFEPEAYSHKEDDSRIELGWAEHKRHKAEADMFIPLEDEETKKPKKKEKRKLKTARELMSKDLPEPAVFVGVGDELPLLVEGTCVLSAKPKLGKSWFALALCVAVANGKEFLGRKTRKCSTLYLDLETSEQLQQKRLRKVLNGAPVPENFYIETKTDNLDDGFVEQIEDYLKQDPDIGIIVVDVFQIIRSEVDVKAKENEYAHVYRDITPLNDIAQRHHLSIILVCHDRKMVDPEDPFSNILGSTGLQGAATQMMVMFKKRKDDPIHISIKGKTIDGLPDLDVNLDNGRFSIVDHASDESRRKSEEEEEYKNSMIRIAVVRLAKEEGWRGRCSQIISDAVGVGVPITDDPKTVGTFVRRHQGRFLKNDNVLIRIIDNGSGSKLYSIKQSTVDTVDGEYMGTWETVDNTEFY